jgi:peptidoglycan/LPS O-acetylase OafA/YrhL
VRYRPHIDGLRAVAIIPVLLFHLGVAAVPGGFIGVDVFFVVSGYLITSVLMNDLESGRYSVARFYQRRILRIFPALIVMLVVVAVVSVFVYFPSDLRSVGWQLLTSAAFVSNFYFWSEAGYFTAAAETQPLLHTWSLAVEEQFYIFFPLLLFVLFRYARKHLVVILAVLSVVSLIASIVLTYRDQPTAFYLLPTRAWELGVGAILSIVVGRSLTHRPNGWVAFVGALLILVPVLVYQSGNPPFPGWSAVFPVVGTALVIGWAEGSLVGKILSSRPVAYIGKVSFSLYLWHWPIIVFYKAVSGPALAGWEMLGLGLASLACGVVSTEFVERPFRTPRARSTSAPRVIAIGTACLVVVVAIGSLQAIRPTSAVADADVLAIADVADYRGSADYERQFRKGTCLIGEDDGGFDAYDAAACAQVDPDRLNVLLIGDSHAAQFWGALDEAYPQANVMQATASGCRFLLDSPGELRCTELRSWVFDEFLPNAAVDVVILGGRWEADEVEFVRPTLERLDELTTKVVVFGPTVEYDGVFPTLLAHSLADGVDFDVAKNRVPGREDVDDAMRDVVETAGAGYVDVLGAICSDYGSCVLYAPDGYPMQFDYGHLTLSGSRLVVEAESEVLDPAFAAVE